MYISDELQINFIFLCEVAKLNCTTMNSTCSILNLILQSPKWFPQSFLIHVNYLNWRSINFHQAVSGADCWQCAKLLEPEGQRQMKDRQNGDTKNKSKSPGHLVSCIQMNKTAVQPVLSALNNQDSRNLRGLRRWVSQDASIFGLYFWQALVLLWASQGALVVKNPPAKAGDIRDTGSILGSGRSPGGGHSNPFQYSCMKNLMDRKAWQVTVYRVAQSQTQLKRLDTCGITLKLPEILIIQT